MQEIINGYLKFRREAFPERAELFGSLAGQQNPGTLFIACSDSRVVPELLTQQEPGGLFVIRNAGNIVPAHGPQPGGVTAGVEYAVAGLGVRHIVVCGHSDCGAMTALMQGVDLDHLPAVAGWLAHASAAKAVNDSRQHATATGQLSALVRGNVMAQLANLKTHPAVARAMDQGQLALHGWAYDIQSGHMEVLDEATGHFQELANHQQGSRANTGIFASR